jgi:hypothetical protein
LGVLPKTYRDRLFWNMGSGAMTTKWKLAKGKTWRQKLEQEHPNHGRIVAIPPRMQKRFGTGTMLIPKP